MQTALLIFIVLFAAAIGFFLGLFLLSVDSPLLKKLFQKDGGEEDPPPAEQEIGPSSTAPVPQIKKPSQNSRLILQIWKEEGKPPVYDLAGKYIPKEELPREILNLITVAEPAPPVQEKKPPEPLALIVDEPPPKIKVEEDEEAEPEGKMLSVIDEVNEILQKKLHGSRLAGRGIHLMENHNKEIRFWVGLNSYNDVDEIPDQDVRNIIDEAVREWEQNRS